MPNTWENGGHVDHNPIVEARAAHLMGHQRRVARSAVAIQTGCRAACREQTAADVLEARKALLLFLSVRRGVYEKGPVRSLSVFAQAEHDRARNATNTPTCVPNVTDHHGTLATCSTPL